MANGPLLAVAALVPAEHEVVILDENIEEIDFQSLKRFDVIGVTGMIVQANRMIEILTELRNLPATLVVGGPYVTLCEQLFEEISDVRFIGEAEQTWPAFLTAFASVRRPCPAGIVDELYSLVRKVERVNLGALRTYIEVLRDNSGTLGPNERFLVSRIEGLERLVAAK